MWRTSHKNADDMTKNIERGIPRKYLQQLLEKKTKFGNRQQDINT